MYVKFALWNLEMFPVSNDFPCFKRRASMMEDTEGKSEISQKWNRNLPCGWSTFPLSLGSLGELFLGWNPNVNHMKNCQINTRKSSFEKLWQVNLANDSLSCLFAHGEILHITMVEEGYSMVQWLNFLQSVSFCRYFNSCHSIFHLLQHGVIYSSKHDVELNFIFYWCGWIL